MRSEVRKIHYEVTQTRNLLSHSVFLSIFFFLDFGLSRRHVES